MILTVVLPDGSNADLDVAPAQLVYDGSSFLNPENAFYVALYTVPVAAVSTEHRDVMQDLTSRQCYRCAVINRDPTPVIDTDTRLVVQVDPTGGECVCGITCAGTEIRYAQVYISEA